MPSLTTINEYKKQLEKLEIHNINYKMITDIESLITKIKNITKKDGNIISISTQKLYFLSVHWYIKTNTHNEKHLSYLLNEVEKINKIQTTQIGTHTLINNQKQNYMEWDDILSVYNKLKLTYLSSYNSHKTFVLLSCYVLLCPRRLKDYALMYVKDNDNDLDGNLNYYIRTKSVFIFNNYKTSSTYKRQQINIVPELATLLNEFIDKYNATDSLFIDDISANEKAKCKAINGRLTRVFMKHTGKNISVNILRHSYISHMKNTGKILGKENNIAREMSHSSSTQNDYYKMC